MVTKISRSELVHLQLQAMLRENKFPSSEIMYCGEGNGEHWYLIGGEHEVPVSQIVDINPVDEDQEV